MKKQMKKFLTPALAFIFLSAVFANCKKEEDAMVPPTLEFKTGAGYTSSDATVAQTTSVLIGVHGEKAEGEGEDVLKTFSITYSYDGGAEAAYRPTEILDASQEDSFDEDIPILTRGVAGTEKYTFTITNRDGLVTTKSITLTVN